MYVQVHILYIYTVYIIYDNICMLIYVIIDVYIYINIHIYIYIILYNIYNWLWLNITAYLCKWIKNIQEWYDVLTIPYMHFSIIYLVRKKCYPSSGEKWTRDFGVPHWRWPPFLYGFQRLVIWFGDEWIAEDAKP